MEHLLCNLMGKEGAFTLDTRKSFALTTFKYLMQLRERRLGVLQIWVLYLKARFEELRVVNAF